MLNADRAKDPEYSQRKLAKGQTITLADQVKDSRMWPTPRASEAGPDFAKLDRSKTGISLQTAVAMWPTPRACEGDKPPMGKDKRHQWLAHRVYATPKSRDWKGQSQRGIHAPGDALPNMDRGDGKPVGGSLNPTWVEWLMGWPLGMTSTEPMPPETWAAWQLAFGIG